MPFKDSPEGQTHSYNDGCGEPAHNDTDHLKPVMGGREKFKSVPKIKTCLCKKGEFTYNPDFEVQDDAQYEERARILKILYAHCMESRSTTELDLLEKIIKEIYA